MQHSTSTTEPAVPLDVRPATAADVDVLDRLWALFQHDMSAVTGALPDARGRFRDERLRAARSDPGWEAWLARLGGRPAGLAVVRGLDAPVRVLSGFFVVRAARRGGVGRRFARSVLTSRRGDWEVAFQHANGAAAAFWPRVAADVAPGAWTLAHRPVPGRPELPRDAWIRLRVP
ncbi:GNAT family N-acetyltransferase [Isoptericola sp. BMS4]|uniref:GNAT family N-acetyltransferase n=1 Tax=Isoptericola sp. BMS4 TaxID=2527875 RepID=UPI0014234DA7|nr:GNAT family N-acetyltransferase [Isoptericola sp. BMS4]